jgi:ABC-2 type transport system permease protein
MTDAAQMQTPAKVPAFNAHGVAAIYKFEMSRWWRTIGQSLFAPVLSTALYFIVFGSAIGSRIPGIEGQVNGETIIIGYGAFIVPGLIMLSILTESISNASFGIYFPRFSGTIYELLSAPISVFEVVLGYVGAAATKSMVIGMVILATARMFVAYEIAHPFAMLAFLALTCIAFCLFGFILGLWADGFEKLQIVPMLIVTPLTFLGGTFYTLDMLPPIWQEITKLNPVVYLISGFRWSFYGIEDVPIAISLIAVAAFLTLCLSVAYFMFKSGYRLKN